MIVKKCVEAAKPVIVATQMMESMITSMTPTREITTKLAAKVPGKARLLEMTPRKEKGNHPLRTLSSMVHAETVANMAISSRTAGGRDLIRYLQQDRSRPKPQRLQALR